MKVLKKASTFRKKGENIVSSITKMEKDLNDYIAEAEQLQDELDAAVFELKKQSSELAYNVTEKQSLLTNIQGLLGRG